MNMNNGEKRLLQLNMNKDIRKYRLAESRLATLLKKIRESESQYEKLKRLLYNEEILQVKLNKDFEMYRNERNRLTEEIENKKSLLEKKNA